MLKNSEIGTIMYIYHGRYDSDNGRNISSGGVSQFTFVHQTESGIKAGLVELQQQGPEAT